MPEDTQCSACGTGLLGDCPRGLCPRCALHGALALTQAGRSGLAKTGLNHHGPGDPVETPSPELAKLHCVGDYELLEQLGRGGMGVVYRARQKSLNRQVAVKMLLNSALSSPARVRRFEIEAETVARLDHPQIVPIYEVREEDGQPYFSMKLIEGESLAQQIAQRRFGPPSDEKRPGQENPRRIQERIARLMATILHAVHYAHNQGVLHRDIKPGNILIDRAGQPYLTDFGLAKVNSSRSLTGSGALLGTPSYMAPELAAGGEATVASDVYSLGVVLYELLTGRPPFHGLTPVELLRRIVDEDAPHPRSVNLQIDRDLAVVCTKAMEKEPSRRYRSAVELAADLERWLRHEPVLARRAGVGLRASRWMRRNPVGTALIVVLCVGLSACLILLGILSDHKQEAQRTNNTFVKSILQRLRDLPKTGQDFERFSSEELRILLGKSSSSTWGGSGFSAILRFLGRDREVRNQPGRFKVAVFIDQTAMQSLIAGGKILFRIEESMQIATSKPVCLDLRIYQNLEALRADLVSGDVHFASIDGRSCLSAQETEPGVRALVCDQRPGLSTVIFVPADSTIRSLAELRGRSLAIRNMHLYPTSFVFEQLANAGLCSDDVRCAVPGDLERGAPRRPYSRKSPDGYFGDAQNRRINEVLEARTMDAGVALESRLERKQEGVRWRRLVTFNIPEFLWVAGPGTDAQSRDAFVHALQQLRDPTELDFMLLDTETDGFAFTTETKDYLDAVRSAERGQAQFQKCDPPPRNGALTPNSP